MQQRFRGHDPVQAQAFRQHPGQRREHGPRSTRVAASGSLDAAPRPPGGGPVFRRSSTPTIGPAAPAKAAPRQRTGRSDERTCTMPHHRRSEPVAEFRTYYRARHGARARGMTVASIVAVLVPDRFRASAGVCTVAGRRRLQRADMGSLPLVAAEDQRPVPERNWPCRMAGPGLCTPLPHGTADVLRPPPEPERPG